MEEERGAQNEHIEKKEDEEVIDFSKAFSFLKKKEKKTEERKPEEKTEEPKKEEAVEEIKETKEEQKEEPKPEEKEIEFKLGPIIDFVKKHKKIFVFLALILILILTFHSRTQNIPNLQDKYLISPDDPYVFFRYSSIIAEQGKLPANDMLRYYPMGYPTAQESTLGAYIAGYSFKAASSVSPDITMYTIAAYYAPILLVIALAVFFFLVREIFESDKIALLATGLLAFSNAILFRTAAGFLEKEPAFLPFLCLAFLMYVRAYKKEKDISLYIYAILAGVFTALAGFASGLFLYIIIAIAGLLILEVILDRMSIRKLKLYAVWFISFYAVLMLLTSKYGRLLEIIQSMYFLIPAAGLVFGLIAVFVKKPKKLEKIPTGIFHLLIGIAAVVVLGLIFMGPGSFLDMTNVFYEKLINPAGTSRMTLSVSENQPPFFYGGGRDWWGTFGVIFAIPFANVSFSFGLIFLLFFGGIIWMFYQTFKGYKLTKYLTAAFVVVLCALIFENFSSIPGTQWVNTIFSIQNIYIFAFIAVFFAFLLTAKKDFKSMNPYYLFFLVWSVVGIISSNGAVRLFFMLAFPVSILAAYFIDKSSNWLAKVKPNYKWVPYILAAGLVLIMFFSSTASNAAVYPGLSDWYVSMDWIRTNTSEDSVFTHWWDYGYLVQTKGERATVVDPGNVYGMRNYDTGGYLFNAMNKSEVLKYLNKYSQPDYWLICSEDVPKFYQIARLGSLSTLYVDLVEDESLGKESYFATYSAAVIDYEQQTVRANILSNNLGAYTEYPNVIVYESQGMQSQVMQDFRIGNKLYGGDQTFILRYIIPVSQNSTGPTLALVYDSVNQRSEILPITCECELRVGCRDLNVSGVPVCILKTRNYIEGLGIINIPYKTKDTLFVQLFILDKNITGFEKSYDGGVPVDLHSIRGERTAVKIYKFDYDALEEGDISW